MTTERLELEDATLREWEAVVVHADEEGVVLDRSAFYPGGGGQPPDHGVLLWGGVQTRIVGTRKGEDLRLVPAEGDPLPPAGTAVRGAVDDDRRTALMRTHSAMHLLCGVVSRDYGVPVTGGAMEPLSGRMDFGLDALPDGFLATVQEACDREVALDRAIEVSVLPYDEAIGGRRHQDRDQPAARGAGGGADRRRGRTRPAGGRRHPRRVDAVHRRDAAGQDGEQGQGLPAHPLRARPVTP